MGLSMASHHCVRVGAMMRSDAISQHHTATRSLIDSQLTVFAAIAGLLFLDGRLGLVSFILRRAASLTILAVLAAAGWARLRPMAETETSGGWGEVPSSRDGQDGAPHSRGSGERSRIRVDLRRRIVGWAAVIAAMAIVARAPSVPVTLVGFIIALAAIESGAGRRSSRARLAVGLIPTCLSYLAMRFVVDLVPQAGWIAEAIARGGSRYI